MENNFSVVLNKSLVRPVIFDILALALVFFTPALTHLFNVPIYYAEPMRLMVILSLVHTRKRNAYLLALLLPLFSFVVSGHPVVFKVFLIMMELTLNVWLFFFLKDKLGRPFFAILLSIVGSKAVYYLFKFAFIQLSLIGSGLVSTPLIVQAVFTMLFAGYVGLFFRDRS